MTTERKPFNKWKAAISVSLVTLVLIALALKVFVIDKLPISLTAIREIRSGAGDVGVLADGSTDNIDLGDGTTVPASTGQRPLTPRPMPKLPMPDHPFLMDEVSAGGVHSDTYNSSTTPFGGPLGLSPKATYISTRADNDISMCTPLLITRDEKLASVCVSTGKPSRLVLFDPAQQFKVVATVDTADAGKFGKMEPGLGWYTALDDQGRAIVVNPEQKVRIYSVAQGDDQPRWVVEQEYDLSSILEDREPVMDVKPDWSNNLWFSSGHGHVGFIDAKTGAIKSAKLPNGEVSGTSMAVSNEGVFILTTRAMYRFEVGSDGNVLESWAYRYGKSSSNGDLTAPTLFDDGKLISFGISSKDNDFARVLVLRTDGQTMSEKSRRICEQPVFKAGKGFLANTFVGYGRSLVLQNNYGAGFFEPTMSEPGLARIDVQPDHKGCVKVWENYTTSSKVPPKLSTEDGYVYQYAHKIGTDKKAFAWYLTATDFETGEIISEQFIGSGRRLDSPMLSINFMPGRIMVAGVRNGLVVLQDSPDSLPAPAPAPAP